MRTYWNKRSSFLNKSHFVWLLSGMEALLIEESSNAISKLYPEYEKHHFVITPQFNWLDIENTIINNSLFTTQKLIKIAVPEGKIGRGGSNKMKALISKASIDTILLLIAPKTNASWAKKTAWATNTESTGCHIQHPDLSYQTQLEWANNYVRKKNVTFEGNALRLLVYLCEGNLLALKQEIDFLLLCEEKNITEKMVHKTTQEQSRFSVFHLCSALFKGDAPKALRICRSLRREGIEPVLINSILSREAQLFRRISNCLVAHLPLKSAFNNMPMWPAREKELTTIVQSRPPNVWREATLRLKEIDRQCKGAMKSDPWLSIEQLIFHFSL